DGRLGQDQHAGVARCERERVHRDLRGDAGVGVLELEGGDGGVAGVGDLDAGREIEIASRAAVEGGQQLEGDVVDGPQVACVDAVEDLGGRSDRSQVGGQPGRGRATAGPRQVEAPV